MDEFTFYLAEQGHCVVGTTYEPDQTAKDYFEHIFENHLERFPDEFEQILGQRVKCTHVYYGQLEECLSPPFRAPTPDGTWLYFQKHEYVVSPDGVHYQVHKNRQSRYTLVINYAIGDDYKVVLKTMTKRSAMRLAEKHQFTVQVEVSTRDQLITTHCSNSKEATSPFQQGRWPTGERQEAEQEEEADEAEEEDPAEDVHDLGDWKVGIKDNRTSIYRPGKKENPGRWIPLGNFAIKGVAAIFEFPTGSQRNTIFRLDVYAQISDKDGTLVLTDSTPLQEIPQYGRLEAQVDVTPAHTKYVADVCKVFSAKSSYFRSMMSPKQLMDFVSMHPSSNTAMRQLCIEYFGKQPNGMFVLGNCCFKDGKVITHNDAHCHVSNSIFSGEESLLPQAPRDFPRILLIEQPWIRYRIFASFYEEALPWFFENNVLPAKAAFAAAVMGLFADEFWNHGAVGHGVPFIWINSFMGNTGKTEMLMAINAFLGLRNVKQGNSSKAALFEAFSMQSNMPVCLDELCMATSVEKNAELKELVHGLYDNTTRAVCKKVRTPRSMGIGTSNTLVNKNDGAFWQRIVLLEFEPLHAKQNKSDAYKYFSSLRQLISCVLPDLQMLTWQGKLDKEAITDCTTFMNQACNTHAARNATLWGFLLYYMLLLEHMAQGENHDDIFFWVCTQVSIAHYKSERQSSVLHLFVIALHKVLEKYATNPNTTEDKSIFWHNYRTDQKPEGYAELCTEGFYAVKLDSVVRVLRNFTEFFATETIKGAVQHVEWASFAKCEFYDLKTNPWPICKDFFDEETQTRMQVPLPEAELVPGNVKKETALYFKRSVFDKIIEEFESNARPQVRYDHISIVSDNKAEGSYNFYQAVVNASPTPWFGYRALGSTPLANYHYFNQMQMSSAVNSFWDTLNQEEGYSTQDEEFGDIFNYFQATKYEGEYVPKFELPPSLRYDTNEYLEDENFHAMPDDTDTCKLLEEKGNGRPGWRNGKHGIPGEPKAH